MKTLTLTLLAIFLSISIFAQDEADNPTEIIRVSIASNGDLGEENSFVAGITQDGKKVYLTSTSRNFFPNDDRDTLDLFVHDAESAETSLVLRLGFGEGIFEPSADGQHFAFISAENDIVPSDGNNRKDVFIRNIQTGETKILPLPPETTATFEDVAGLSISKDGGQVAFVIYFSDMASQIFVWDAQSGETKIVSARSDGVWGIRGSQSPSISANGNFVAFVSPATNFVDEENSLIQQVFLKNLDTGALSLISKSANNEPGNRTSLTTPSVSEDGRYTAYTTEASNLLDLEPGTQNPDLNGRTDVYLYDRQLDQNDLLSIALIPAEGANRGGFTSISDDGRYVSFESQGTNLVASDSNGSTDIFVRDRLTNQTRRANVASDGTQASGISGSSRISGDGRYVIFHSKSANLVETNSQIDKLQVYRAPNPFLESVPYIRPDPANNFLWTGDAGDEDWQKPLNWDIKATGEDATVAPGALGGIETVEVTQSAVTLAVSPAHIRSIDARGSLVVSQPLIIEKKSSIENLTLAANLLTGGTLRLSGDNVWNSGIIYGDGSVDLQAADSTLLIDAASGFAELGAELSIGGTVIQTGDALNLTEGDIVVSSSSVESKVDPSDDGTAHGSITVDEGGRYELLDGSTITSDHPSAKLSLKNGSKLTVAEPSNIFDPIGTKIEIPLETSGTTNIALLEKAILENSKTGIFNKSSENDKNTFTLDQGARLSFTAPQVFNVRTLFKRSESLEDMGVVSTSNSLKIGEDVEIDLRFELGGDLDVTQAQFLILEGGRIEWQKGHIKGGSLDGEGLLQNGLVNRGEFSMGVGVPEGGYRLDGIIRNNGIIYIDHNLYFEDGAKILNEKSIKLSGESSMFMDPDSSAEIQVVGESSYIDQKGPGTSNIYIPLKFTDSAMGVIGSETTLILRRSVDFYGEKSRTVVTLGQIEFKFDPGEKLTIHKVLTSKQPGTIKVIDSDVLIKDVARLVVEGGQTSDHITVDGERWLEGTYGWEFDGGTTSIGEGGYILVESGGVLKWRGGIIEGPIGGIAEIENKGLIEILGDDPHELNNYLVNINQLTIKDSITGIGGIFNGINDSEGVVILNNRNTPIDIGVRFSNTKKVIAAFGTKATFSGAVDQLGSSIFGIGQLSGGEWIISNEADLTLKLNGAEKDIQIMQNGAFVELRGSGDLNGLNDVAGDLDIITRGNLHYRDVENAKISGQLTILSSGALRLFGSTLTVSKDLEMSSSIVDRLIPSSASFLSFLVVDETSKLIINEKFKVLRDGYATIDGNLFANVLNIENGGIFGGSGRINALKFTNAGKLLPGNSPGTLTVEGDYVQTETGVLEIEVGGTGIAGTDFDQLIVNGTASLGGTLILKEIDGFEWSDSVPVPAIQATVFEGAFDQVVFTSTSRRIATPKIVGEMFSVAANTLSVAQFGDWRSAHFDEAELADEAISGLLADPDGDGVVNFFEYAFDTLPQYWNAQPLSFDFQSTAVEGKIILEATFPWAKGMTDAQYTLQVSQDLKTWNDFDNSVVDKQDGEFAEMITLTGELDAGSDIPVFARLLITEIDL